MKKIIFVLFCVELLVNNFVYADSTGVDITVKSREYPKSECRCTAEVCQQDDGYSGLASLKEESKCEEYYACYKAGGDCHCENFRCKLKPGADRSTFTVTSRNGLVKCNCHKGGCTPEDGSFLSELLASSSGCHLKGPCENFGFCACKKNGCRGSNRY